MNRWIVLQGFLSDKDEIIEWEIVGSVWGARTPTAAVAKAAAAWTDLRPGAPMRAMDWWEATEAQREEAAYEDEVRRNLCQTRSTAPHPVFSGLTLLFSLLGAINAFGGIVAGFWLLFAGAWWALGYALLGIFVSHILVSILLGPGMLLLGARAAQHEGRGNSAAALRSAVGFAVYAAVVATVFCSLVFWLFVSRATPGTLIPLALWSYGVASGPWTYLSAKDQQAGGNEFSMMSTLFIQFGCLAAAVAVVLLGPSLTLIAAVIGTFMLLSVVAQVVFLRFAQSSGHA
jgi:hypothetical protein